MTEEISTNQLLDQPTILLIGPPNVGKSVIFNHFTDLNVGMANYPGTTVSYTAGRANFIAEQLDDQPVNFIDVPGTYTLRATNAAEQVAVDMLGQSPTLVICVLDARNLDSSLHLLFQVLEYKIPTVVAINRIDLLENSGLKVDIEYLGSLLNIPIIQTVAVEKKGLNELQQEIVSFLNRPDDLKSSTPNPIVKRALESDISSETRWELADDLARTAYEKIGEDSTGIKESWDQLLIEPWSGFPIALLVLVVIFMIIVGLGMGLRQFLLIPLFDNFIIPFIENTVSALLSPGLFREILIGEYGFMIKGLEWPFALVMPYVLSFYVALTLLEDSGYMPRLGILLDGVLNKIGLSGGNIIPLLLGYGCAIPGILAARAMSTRRERLTVAIMISLAVPCIAQTGAFIALLSEFSVWLVPLVFIFSWIIILLAGLVMDLFISEQLMPITLELPELLMPRLTVVAKKIWLRFKHFIFDGAVPMVIGVGIAAVLYETGTMHLIAQFMRPLVDGWLGLPEEAATPLLLGIMRRELTVLPLLDMELSMLQLFVGSVVGLFYVPCIAVIATLAKEYGLRIALGILLLTTTTAFLGGGIILRLGRLFALLI